MKFCNAIEIPIIILCWIFIFFTHVYAYAKTLSIKMLSSKQQQAFWKSWNGIGVTKNRFIIDKWNRSVAKQKLISFYVQLCVCVLLPYSIRYFCSFAFSLICFLAHLLLHFSTYSERTSVLRRTLSIQSNVRRDVICNGNTAPHRTAPQYNENFYFLLWTWFWANVAQSWIICLESIEQCMSTQDIWCICVSSSIQFRNNEWQFQIWQRRLREGLGGWILSWKWAARCTSWIWHLLQLESLHVSTVQLNFNDASINDNSENNN